MTHEIKIHSTYASEHLRGVKDWELRKNDRDYKEGDTVKFIVVTERNEPTGMVYTREITNVFHGGVYGLQDGFCIFSIKQYCFIDFITCYDAIKVSF